MDSYRWKAETSTKAVFGELQCVFSGTQVILYIRVSFSMAKQFINI